MDKKRIYQLSCFLTLPAIFGIAVLATPGVTTLGTAVGVLCIVGSILLIGLLSGWQEQQGKRRAVREEHKREEVDRIQLEKFERLLKVSTRIRIDQVQEILNLKGQDLWDRLISWAEQFNFTIEENVLIINSETTDAFIQALEEEFQTWDTGYKK